MIREVLSVDALCAMTPDEAASRWAVRQSDGGVSDQESAIFEQWLALDAAHRRAWADAVASLRLFDGAGDDELLEAIRRHALDAGPERKVQWRRFAAVAAGIAVIGLVTVLGVDRMGLTDPSSGPRASAVASRDPLTVLGGADYQTAVGEQRRIRLADGSLAVLDTDSAIDLAFTGSRRSIALLKGRVFFDVAHDVARPFSLAAGLSNIVAVGTRFDVRLFRDHVRVGLVEGRLAIAPTKAAGKSTVIEAGQRYDDQGGIGRVTARGDMEDVANWQRGYLTFDDDTLATAAEELNRYGGAQLVVRDPTVAGLRVSGLFKAGDSGRFARSMTVIHPVKVVHRPPNSIEIRPAG